MLEFRLKVPEDYRRRADFIALQEATVCEQLSRCCSPVDGVELAGEVVLSRRESGDGGFWIHGALDRDVVDTAAPVDPVEYEGLQAARTDALAVSDMDVTDLKAHMARKADRS